MEYLHYRPLGGWSEPERLSSEKHGPRSTIRPGFPRWRR